MIPSAQVVSRGSKRIDTASLGWAAVATSCVVGAICCLRAALIGERTASVNHGGAVGGSIDR
jgi:hypothetical protein